MSVDRARQAATVVAMHFRHRGPCPGSAMRTDLDLDPPASVALGRIPRGLAWPLLVLTVLAFTLAFGLLASGCSIPATVPAFEAAEPTSLQSESVRFRSLPVVPRPDFCAWADRKGAELAARYGVPAPAVEFRDEPAPDVVLIEALGFHLVIGQKVGHYERPDHLVVVWLRDSNGRLFCTFEVKRVYLHEWLHHFDQMQGREPPTGDHNDLFEFRIDEMGLDDP